MAMQTTLRHVLLINYALPAEHLARPIPGPLKLDTHCGSVWISVLAFDHENFAPLGLVGPHIRFPQINYRTYVHWRGERGVYFFRADLGNPWLARASHVLFGMPWRAGKIELTTEVDPVDHSYRSWSIRSDNFEATARPASGSINNSQWFLSPARGFFTHWDGAPRRFKIRRSHTEILPANVTVSRADYLIQLGVLDITAPRSAFFIPEMDFAFSEFPPEFA
jgi:uncharacterized protein YqjF (DUF2071 family)